MRFFTIPTIFTISLILVCNSITSSDMYINKIDKTLLEEITGTDKPVKVIVWVDERKYKAEKEIVASNFGKIKHQYDIIPAIAMEISPNNLYLLANQDYVKKIEPTIKVKAFLQDTVSIINATKVWTQQISGINITGKGITVCVLDTGVNYSHPDLGGCFGAGCKVIDGYDYVNSDGDPMDDEGHGTHVAGIVAADGGIKGVAPNVSIVAIKVLDSAGVGNSIDAIAGINWCVNNASVYNISVISMSFGTETLFSGYCDNVAGLKGFRDAINAAIAKNISVVVATGNNGNLTSISAPACIQNATAVSSTTKTDAISSFSNRNNITDLIAPGSSINSTSISGSYTSLDGTSMAAPHVSGALALLYQKYKLMYGINPTPSYLQQVLNDTGVKINDTGGTKLNFSRIDVYNASSVFNDTQAPRWSDQSIITTVERGQPVNLSVLWSDNVMLANATLSTNETNAWENKSTIPLDSPVAWSNFTWVNFSLPNNTVVSWKIYANDTSGNENLTSTFNFTVVDTKGPLYFNITNSTDATYALYKNYQFNITLQDYSSVSTVIFEWDSSNTTITTYREINSTTREYYTNKTDLSAGNYSYKWFFNDTVNNWNSTPFQVYNITKSTPSLSLVISPNNSTVYSIVILANGSIVTGDTVANISLYRNGSLVNSSTASYAFENITLGVGVYNYTLTYNGTQNYTFTSITNVTIVTAGPTSVSLWLNGTQNNKTYDRGVIANITAQINVSSLNVTIAANYTGSFVDINNSTSTVTNLTNTSNLAIGMYNITAYYNGYNSNYSSSSKSYFLIVREAYRNSSINITNNSLTLINASSVNITLKILTNDTLTNECLNVTVGKDNPVGVYPQAVTIRYISIEPGINLTTNLTYAIINASYLDSDVPDSVDGSSLRLYRWSSINWVII